MRTNSRRNGVSVMFGVIDAGGPRAQRGNNASDRACDQCKLRKVRCDMTRPCAGCSSKGFDCTYDKARKKRGPSGKRIAEIRRQQNQPATTSPNGHVRGDSYDGESSIVSASPPSYDAAFNFQQVNADSSAGASNIDYDQAPVQLPYWPSGTSTSSHASTYPSGRSSFNHAPPPLPDSAAIDPNIDLGSSIEGDFVFPSLPLDSPSSALDPFGAITQQDLPQLPHTADIWPSSINEDTLLPWIDVYFKRLHPTIPILHRTNLYRDMLMRRHRTDSQYGSMLLGLCAFAMTQPVQIHERASTPSRDAQARMLLEACVKMRVAADFGEHPTIEMILTSFFLFACLFGNSQHKAARHRLREAVDLAYSLNLHLPQSYDSLDHETREQWLRTYLVLSVTERAYGLQQGFPIGFRGRPGIAARFMQAFDAPAATEYISQLIYQDQSDAVAVTGLLYLMDAFDAIDESVLECWNGYCKYSDGECETFDRRRALQMFRAQQRAREDCLAGNISFAPTARPVPLAELVDSQQADISVTQFWLLNRLWNLCLSHGLLRESSDRVELRFEYACRIARMLLATTNELPLHALEVHGIGMVEKIHDIGTGIITALNSSTGSLALDSLIPGGDSTSSIQHGSHQVTVKEMLQRLDKLVQSFRGGDHQYVMQFSTSLRAIPGYYE